MTPTNLFTRFKAWFSFSYNRYVCPKCGVCGWFQSAQEAEKALTNHELCFPPPKLCSGLDDLEHAYHKAKQAYETALLESLSGLREEG